MTVFVRQAANVVDLLEYFAERQKPATLAEISDDLGWPRSSTFNLIGTLAAKGYLYEPNTRSGYYPSPRWLAVVEVITDAQPLPDVVRQIVDEIVEETGETTAIVAPAGPFAIFIYVKESRQPIRYFAKIGQRLPIHASSSGRAILQQCSVAERKTLYNKIRFERYSLTTPVSIEDVEAEIRRGTQRGYQCSRAEYSADFLGISLPFPILSRRLALLVGGPMSRLQDKTDSIAEIMKKTLERFASPLGALSRPVVKSSS